MRRLTGYILLCGMLAALCAVSCIKEDRDDCLSSVALTFLYNHNPEYTDLFASNADLVRLYVYDSDGKYLFSRDVGASSLENKNTINLQLDQGKYTIAAWVNYNEDEFECPGEHQKTLEEITLNIKTNADGCVSGNNTNLFHGITVLDVPRLGALKDTVPVIRDTNDIMVLIQGLESITESPYTMSIAGHDGTYHFDNRPVTESPPVTYLAEYSYETLYGETYPAAVFKVMRLWTGSDVMLNIMKNGVTMVSENLVEALQREFIQLEGDDDLDRFYDFKFIYRFDSDSDAFALVRILVGDWEAVIGEPGEI